MSTEIVVAFITGLFGPLSVIVVNHYLTKKRKKPDLVEETLKISELVTSKIEHSDKYNENMLATKDKLNKLHNGTNGKILRKS